MRFRELQAVEEQGVHETLLTRKETGQTEVYASSPYVAYASKQTMFDVVTPNFRKRLAQGEVLNNPMLQQISTVEHKPSSFVWEYDITGAPFRERWTGTWNPVMPEYNIYNFDAGMGFYDGMNGRDLAIAKAWSNVDVSEAALLASLGELPETIKWIQSILLRARTILLIFKKKLKIKQFVPKSGSDVLDSISDVWLELRYALRPLIFEMDQAVQAAKTVLEKGIRKTARGFESTVSSVYSEEQGPWVFLGHSETKYHRVDETRVNFRAGVLYQIESDINALASVWGLNKPIETIWELTPFSFMVDWFFNVGNVISSWTVKPYLTSLASWIVEEISVTTSMTLSYYNNTYNSPVTGFESEDSYQAGTSRAGLFVKRRIVAPDRPVLPTLDLNLDVAKITDIALIGRKLFQNMRS